MNAKLHDFRKPPRLPGNLEQRLASWLRIVCQLAGQRCRRHLTVDLEIELGSVELLPPEIALDRIPEGSLGFRIDLVAGESSSLFTSPRPLALALVAGALGDSSGVLPTDRELTLVEESLCEYLVQQLFASALHESWPGHTPLPASASPSEPSTRWGRLFAGLEHVVICSILLRGPLGEHTCYWLASPRGPMEQLAQSGRVAESQVEPSGTHKLEALVRELPVEIVVALGETELSLSQVGSLKPGDLLLLEQRVAEPLLGLLDGQKKFKAWPGRVGSRQAIQVESFIG